MNANEESRDSSVGPTGLCTLLKYFLLILQSKSGPVEISILLPATLPPVPGMGTPALTGTFSD